MFLEFFGGLSPENGYVEQKSIFWKFMYIFKPFFLVFQLYCAPEPVAAPQVLHEPVHHETTTNMTILHLDLDPSSKFQTQPQHRKAPQRDWLSIHKLSLPVHNDKKMKNKRKAAPTKKTLQKLSIGMR